MILNLATLTGLPLGPMVNICRYLDLESIRKLSLIPNRRIHSVTERVLGKTAKSLDWPVDPAKSDIRNYNDFVKDLVVRIKKYPDDEVPADIQEIIELAMEKAPSVVQVRKLQEFILVKDLVVRIKKYPAEQVPADIQDILDVAMGRAPTVAQVRKLQEFIKARDTLVVWYQLAGRADIEVDLSGAFVSADVAIEKAKDFTIWMEENNEGLLILRGLGLYRLHLTSIPKELGGLQNLEMIQLNFNQLTSIPAELGDLQNLQMLDLRNNQLTSIPETVQALRVNLEGNPLELTAEEPEELIDEPIPVEIRVVPKELREFRTLLGAGAIAMLSTAVVYYSDDIEAIAEGIYSIAEEFFFGQRF